MLLLLFVGCCRLKLLVACGLSSVVLRMLLSFVVFVLWLAVIYCRMAVVCVVCCCELLLCVGFV